MRIDILKGGYGEGLDLVGDGFGVVSVVPVHGGDAVELLHAEHGAQVVCDLLQRLLVLLMDHQERHRLRAPAPPLRPTVGVTISKA